MKDHCEAYLPSQQISQSQTAFITRADVSYISAEKNRGQCVIARVGLCITFLIPVSQVSTSGKLLESGR